MNTQESKPAALPPEVAAYLSGPPSESKQFDFLIGDWNVEGIKFKDDGSELMRYRASWSARHLNGGRMIMDDFKVIAPTGQEMSSMVTLRTYCEATRRWELTGLAAHQPAWNAQWYGHRQNGEMLLAAIGATPNGLKLINHIRFFDIAENAFLWESQISLDDGVTWTKAAALKASRTIK